MRAFEWIKQVLVPAGGLFLGMIGFLSALPLLTRRTAEYTLLPLSVILCSTAIVITLLNKTLAIRRKPGSRLLVVGAVFAMLGFGSVACISYGTYAEISTLRDFTQAFGEIKDLERAIIGYHRTVGKWPCKNNGQPDKTYGPGTQKEIIDILTAHDPSENPDRLIFLEIHPKRLRNGEVQDPSGQAYCITLDTDFDKKCVTAGHGTIEGKEVVIWSEMSTILKSWCEDSQSGP